MNRTPQPTSPQDASAQRRAFAIRATACLLTGISIAATTINLLRRKKMNRLIRRGFEAMPMLALAYLGHRNERRAAAATPPAPLPWFRRSPWAYIWPIILCLGLGALAGWLQRDAMTAWYPALLKPAGTPPNILFPIAWGIIYVLMGISAGRVLTAPGGPQHETMTIWGIQLEVNFLWSLLFFLCRSPLLGMIDIVVLDALVVLYMVRSRQVRQDAMWLFVPYLCWLLYATYLNAWILAMNGPGI